MDDLITVLETMRREIECQYGGRLRNIAQRYDTDDLIQDISANVLRRGHRCRGETFDERRRFLRVVAKNTYLSACATHIGTGKRSVRREADSGMLGSYQYRTQSAHDALCVREQCDEAISLLDDLPPRQRQAITMHAVEGKPYSEIAEQLGTTIEAARTLVSQGRRKVRAAAEAKQETHEARFSFSFEPRF